MNRPYIICHMLQSIDGRISGQFFTMKIHKTYQVFIKK